MSRIIIFIRNLFNYNQLKLAKMHFNIGTECYKHKENENYLVEAFSNFSLSAKYGLDKGQYALGIMYLNGEGISKDISQAIYWLELSANQNFPEAQYILGTILFNSESEYHDSNKALILFERASKNGLISAQNLLGTIYFSQKNQFNLHKAIFWLKKAAKSGVADAQFNLGLLYYWWQEKSLKNTLEAIRWLEMAIKQDHTQAYCRLAEIYIDGLHVKKDLIKAARLMKIALNKGDKDAEYFWNCFELEKYMID